MPIVARKLLPYCKGGLISHLNQVLIKLRKGVRIGPYKTHYQEKTLEILIIVGGLYALYTVGMAIATELDYRAFNREELRKLREENDKIMTTIPSISVHTK